jgi:type I restriction enzyme S subunit
MEYALSELFTLQMGKTPSRDNSSYWKKSENNWISIADLTNSGKYISNTKETLSDSAVAESGIKKIPANTVIMSFKLSLGKVAITEKEMYSNEAIMAFIDKGVEKISPEYLYYLLRAKDWSKGTNKAVMGATLNKATLSTIKIQLHEYDNQLEIVNMLNRVSSSIDFRKQQLTKLDELIKARFVEMFGNAETTSQAQTKRLEECCISISGGNTPSMQHPEYYGGKIPFIKSGDVKSDHISVSSLTLTQIALNETTVKMLPKGTLIVVIRSAALLKEFRIGILDVDAVINQDLKALQTSDDVLPVYLMWAIKMKSQVLLSRVQTMLTSHIRMEDLLDLKVQIPHLSLQNQFANFVAEINKSKLLAEVFAQSTCILAENRSK